MSDAVANVVDAGENEEQGCTLEIQCYTAGQDLSARIVARWLDGDRRSSLAEEYVKKIMTFKLWQKSDTEKDITYATIRFDSTVNCFEAMQQIRTSTIRVLNDGFGGVYTQRVKDITCPHGQFKRVTLHPKDFNFIKTKEVRELLRQYGEICKMEHLVTETLRDGRVEVVMFVPGGEANIYLPLSECDKDRKLYEKIEIEWYYEVSHRPRICAQMVLQLWDKYGPNGSRNNAERALTQLAIE